MKRDKARNNYYLPLSVFGGYEDRTAASFTRMMYG